MGRPSKLTTEQWLEVEHRHVVDKVPVLVLAKEYGVNESAIRRKIRPNLAEQARGITKLRDLAEEKVHAERNVAVVDAKIAELPEHRQIIVHDLAQRIKSVAVHLTCAAEASARTARKLTMLAEAQANRIDVDRPLTDKTRNLVTGISAITRTANEAGSIGMGLIAAHRVGLPGAADVPDGGVVDLTDEELDAELRANGIEPP